MVKSELHISEFKLQNSSEARCAEEIMCSVSCLQQASSEVCAFVLFMWFQQFRQLHLVSFQMEAFFYNMCTVECWLCSWEVASHIYSRRFCMKASVMLPHLLRSRDLQEAFHMEQTPSNPRCVVPKLHSFAWWGWCSYWILKRHWTAVTDLNSASHKTLAFLVWCYHCYWKCLGLHRDISWCLHMSGIWIKSAGVFLCNGANWASM